MSWDKQIWPHWIALFSNYIALCHAMPPQNRPHLQSHYRMQRNTQCLHVQVDWIKYQKKGPFFAHIMCGSLGTNDICTDYLIVEFVVSNDNDALRVRVLFYFTAHLPTSKASAVFPSVHITAGRSKFIYHCLLPKSFQRVKSFVGHTIRVQHHSPNGPTSIWRLFDFMICLFMKSFQLARSAYFHFSH